MAWDVVGALGLKNPILVGHSMGGMIAAEMAAICPREVSRLALIAPAGLWLDDHPVADVFTKLPYEMPALLFHDEAAGAARLTAGLKMDDPKFLQAYLVANARQLGMAGRLLFPIPERGLSERLYRVTAKTVLVWGDSDKLIVPAYGDAFQSAIARSQLVRVAKAGHMLPQEQPAAVIDALARLG
jgi:pimeloyl-ACP methyl ester carboxylesterase